MKLAVVMTNNDIVIQQLAGDFDFGASITAQQISQIVDDSKATAQGLVANLAH